MSYLATSSLHHELVDVNIEPFICAGEILEDKSKSGKPRPWRKHKLESIKLMESYMRLGYMNKAKRVQECGTQLRFLECPNGHSRKKLVGGCFCQVRLCPLCAWRRSYLSTRHLRKVTHIANEREKISWAFLTLTVKNVDGQALSNELDKMFQAWKRLTERKAFENNVVGWFRGLEVTRNSKDGTYHPHFHVLLAVRPSYFSHGYIKQAEWAELWKKCLRVDYTPIVDIRKVRPKKGSSSLQSAIVEVAKYPTKPTSYLVEGDIEATDDAVSVLDDALANRRLLAYGGLLKEIWNELKNKGEVSDVESENVDLIGADDVPEGCQCPTCGSAMLEVFYQWNRKKKNYVSKGSVNSG